MSKVNVAVVGVTGAVGEVMLEILESRDFPVDTLYPLASARSAGKSVQFPWQTTCCSGFKWVRFFADADCAFLSGWRYQR